MAISIEISDHHRVQLLEIAARRGLEDYSLIVQEAIEQYLAGETRSEQTVRAALSVLGSLDDEEADALEASVREIRRSWR